MISHQPTVRAVTHAVKTDEPALWLSETVRPVMIQDHHEVHRMLSIVVRRGDEEVEYLQDLGNARFFVGAPFLLPGGGRNQHGYIEPVETVGSLMDLAVELRNMKPLKERRGLEFPNLVEKYREQSEEAWKQSQHQSVFGNFMSKQRA